MSDLKGRFSLVNQDISLNNFDFERIKIKDQKFSIAYIDTSYKRSIINRIVKVDGWVASSHPIHSFGLFVNRKRLDFVDTYDRMDVQETFKTKYVVGWTVFFEVEAFIQNELGSLIFEVVEGDFVLGRLYHKYKPVKKSDNSLIYFMHIPKTAGSSTRIALEGSEDIRLLSVYNNPPFIKAEQLVTFSKSALDDVDVVFGHYAYGLHKQSKRRHKYITVLRRPRDHIISCYFYMKYVYPDPRIIKCSSIFEAVKSVSEVTFDNYLVRYISGHLGPEPVTQHHLDIAINNIMKDFLYVGRVEDYKISLENISYYIGFSLPNKVENVTPITDEMRNLNVNEVERQLSDRYIFDTKLYEFVERRFPGVCFLSNEVPAWSDALGYEF